MFFPLKLLLFVASPILLIAGAIFVVMAILSIDDLSACYDGPQLQTTGHDCRPADAIVAISGGDTDARTREAIRLYKAGWAPKLVLSGAAEDKNSISNAAAMRAQALRAGVQDAAISLDEHALDTAGNAAGILAIAQKQGLTRVIVVTSPYHQRRASIEFQRTLGPAVVVMNHPTPEDRYWLPSFWWLNPYSWYLAVGELTKLIYLSTTGVA